MESNGTLLLSQGKCFNHNELTGDVTVSLEYTTGRGAALSRPLPVGCNIGRDNDIEAE